MIAIIIPAYKETYFREALDSLANQTNKNFRVYIGDDNSPNDLKSIVDCYLDRLDIEYTRFPNNIGSEEIVRQWQRCVTLSKNEEWLWLFSDDDIADVKAVENFYSVASDKFDVYRFNTCVIDAKSQIVVCTPTGPMEESSANMAYNLLLSKRGNSMPDHIFSRKVYEINGGFVYTKFAQAADWATSILFSEDKGIRIIPESRMYWRLSGTNISSIAAENRAKMLEGHLQFIKWISIYFADKVLEENITYNMMLSAARTNLKNIIISHYKGLDNKSFIHFAKVIIKYLHFSLFDAVYDLYEIKRATGSKINKPINFIKKIIN